MSSLRITRLLAALLALVLVAGACSSSVPTVIVSGDDPTTSAKDLYESLSAEGFTVMTSLLDEADMGELLQADDGDTTYTVFAPTDAAFDELAPGLVAILNGEEDTTGLPISADRPSASEIKSLLADILRNHIAQDTLLIDESTEPTTLTSLEGGSLRISTREEPATTEGGEPTEIPVVNDIDIAPTNLFATNGVIQTIDTVLVPADRQAELDAIAKTVPEVTDIMSTLRELGDHAQLLAALETTGLADTLESAENVTVFAPTDAAFTALTGAEAGALEDKAVQRQILKYHLLNRKITKSDVLNTRNAVTEQGESVVITKSGDEYTVNEIPIVASVNATNGVIHVIDTLLVPDAAKGPGGF